MNQINEIDISTKNKNNKISHNQQRQFVVLKNKNKKEKQDFIIMQKYIIFLKNIKKMARVNYQRNIS